MFIEFYWKNNSYLLLGDFNMRSLLNAILVSTWLHFCSKNLPKSRLGGFLERLGRILGRLGDVLGRLGAVLDSSWSRLGPSWRILEASWTRLGAT